MADYEYQDLSAAPSLEWVKNDVAASAMSNKDIGPMTYSPDNPTYNKYLVVHFDVALSGGDKAIFDGIVADSLGKIWEPQSQDVSAFVDQNSVVVDQLSGKRGFFDIMQVLVNRRELFNDTDNPLYHASFIPLLGANGSVTNLDTIHGKLGWHQQQVRKALYRRPKDLLVYYGWLNSFNSAQHGWNNEKVAQEMAKYDVLVFGDGIEDPGHGDYANTQIIIPRIKALNPNALIFGYVSVNQGLTPFQTKVDQWDTLQVHGIFLDEAGYDYGKTRDEFNARVDYVHGKTYAKVAFANAWNMDHVLGVENDPSYPNSTYNPSLTASRLTANDWCLLESFPVNTTAYVGSGNDGYEPKADWAVRGVKAIDHRANFGINLAAVGIIANGHGSGVDLFGFQFVSALMFSLEAAGSSDTSYGAGSAAVQFWTRPGVTGPGRYWSLNPSVQVDNGDADVYRRYVEAGRLMLDFSNAAQDSAVEDW